MPLFHFVEVLLRHPIVVGALALVVAILSGAGKAVGLPRLFWHERRLYRFLAGLTTTLLAAESLLVTYLLEGESRFPGAGGFNRFLIIGGIAWVVVVGTIGALQTFRQVRSTSQPGRMPSSGGGIAPGIRALDEPGPAQRTEVQLPVVAFMAGVALAVGVVFLVVLGTRQIHIPLIEERLYAWLNEWRPVSDPGLHVVAAISFALPLATFVVLRRQATPGVGICVLLALVLAAYAGIQFWAQNSGLGFLILLALLWWSGGPRYKLRIPSLSQFYRSPLPYPPPDGSQPRPERAPLRYDAALDAPGGEPGGRRLIIVCASGGGIRAGTWTAAVLGQLDEIEGFRAATRLLTGASGGMVGAASWLALAAKRNAAPGVPAPPDSWPDLMKAVAMDSLTPAARQLVFHDIPLAFLSLNNLHDRGLALEEAWCENLKSKLGIDLRISFGELRSGEESGRWPSLVFSPMLVEDGRRLILSNLDLTRSTNHYVRWLSSKDSGPEPVTGCASRTAYHLFQVCPQDWTRFPLSTAARLSASFPYVSPAVLLPTEPRRRAVDAGYYDNYGLELGCSWLRELLEQRKDWLEKNISGVLVIQIRDNVSELSVNPESEEQKRQIRERARSSESRLSRSLEGLTSPPAGVLAARESVTLFRNDAQLEALSHLYASAFHNEDFLTTTVFEFRGEASLSWHLAEDEVSRLEAQARAKGIREKLDAIKSWLKRTDYWARRPSSVGA